MINVPPFLLSILMLTFAIIQAQPSKRIKQMADSDSARLVGIFEDIHQNPELAFMETRTAAIIAKEFSALGYKVITGIGKTGVVGILKNGEGPVVMYRAELDCNAVKEVTSLPYASTKTMINSDGQEVPVMHACGHDAHIAWMLGIARIMVMEIGWLEVTSWMLLLMELEVMVPRRNLLKIRLSWEAVQLCNIKLLSAGILQRRMLQC